MRIRIPFFFILFAFAAITANAQSNDTKAAQAKTEESYWTPSKVIPVASYYEGGQEAMYKAIYEELSYPQLAKRNRVQGECIVSFTINPDGSTSNFKVLRTAGAGTGEEALRVAKLLKFNSPGFGVDASIPIMFRL
ncbi:energy transducer TonB [Pontibacter korlensis]|uniref:Energy transducer TonB n=1 Tax=Pontibacter korlensis TaxID=400092 RepID=A0A0E3UZU4_9BACT|nr:energy transducer TonB [Pontibacter korlensis]AKD05636.1 energy transducer TonB [Pontibacter korlensis]